MLFVVYAFLLHTEHFISFTPFSCCGWTIDCGIWRILRFHYSTPLTQFATSTFSCWKFRIEGNLAPIYLRSSHENVYTHVLQKQKVVTMLHEALTAFMKYVYVFRLAGTTVSNDLLCTLRNLRLVWASPLRRFVYSTHHFRPSACTNTNKFESYRYICT